MLPYSMKELLFSRNNQERLCLWRDATELQRDFNL